MSSLMLVSLSEVKAFLDITVTDYDSLINTLIQNVSDRIQTFLNRQLLKEQRTQYFTTGKKKYYVNGYPVDTSTTITVMIDNDIQAINDDYYLWADDGLFEFEYTATLTQPKEMSITYTGGYPGSLTMVGGKATYVLSVPDAIGYACLLQVAFIFRRRKDIGLTSISMPDGSVSTLYAGDLLPEVKNILKMYRKSPMDY
jgi:hypothetical protein